MLRLLRTSGIALIALVPSLAGAVDAKSLYDTCFARTYDAAHLAKHPQQSVTALRVSFQQFEDDLNAGITYSVRADDKERAYSGDCFKPIAGGFSCTGCKGDSCEDNGETFKILVRDKDTIELVNDTTGLTASIDAGAYTMPAEKLEAGGEHRNFVLKRASADVCGKE